MECFASETQSRRVRALSSHPIRAKCPIEGFTAFHLFCAANIGQKFRLSPHICPKIINAAAIDTDIMK